MLVQERYWHGKRGDALCSFAVRNSHPFQQDSSVTVQQLKPSPDGGNVRSSIEVHPKIARKTTSIKCYPTPEQSLETWVAGFRETGGWYDTPELPNCLS